MRKSVPCGAGLFFLLVFLAAFSSTTSGALALDAQPLTQDAAAMMVLDSARRAYNDGKCDFAAERFREFLKQYGGHKEAPSAQYGLALALLELPQKDYPNAIAALQQAAGRQDFAERPFVLYYLGSAQRGVGGQNLEQAAAKPNEAPRFLEIAKQNFGEAAKNFSAAGDAFAQRAKASPIVAAGLGPASPAVPRAGTPLPQPFLEWMVRSRCDYCDMLLRLDRAKEAADLAQKLLADKNLEMGRFHGLALYHLGYASYALRDYLAAGRALSQLAPFQQEFGVHARYLLSRTHHLSGERPEAAAGYKALLADYEQQKKAAAEAMKNPAALPPQEKTRLEALLKAPPEYILRATFYNCLLAAEEGRCGEALEGLNALAQQNPGGGLLEEVHLRQGYCLLAGRNFPEAIKLLQPLQNHPQLGDRATWWLARAQAGSADPANAPAYEQALRSAIEMLGRAADRAGELGRADPEAKLRRGDILLELGDTQQLTKLYREAAATYQRVIAENSNPGRPEDATGRNQCEEAMQRQATALHLAGQYKESDDLCLKFEQAYPKSTLLPAVWFRAAENASLPAVAAANDPNMRGRRNELVKMFDEAIKRYQRLLSSYPDFPYINLARYGLATAQYQKGQYAEAIATLSDILEADRNGELAPVNYLLSDCYIRLFPPEAVDAIQAAQMIEQAEQAARLLEKYIGSQGKSPQVPDALLKLGYCYQRTGMILIDAAEKTKTITQARQTYERVLQEFPTSPALAGAVLERARCIALLGDPNGAINELGRFSGDPLKQSPMAPLAMIRQASLLRALNRQEEAVKLVAQCRALYEQALQNDPERGYWVLLMQYEHALALKDCAALPNRGPALAEARKIFESISKQFASRPEAASAFWRAGQCRREELQATLAAARAVPLKPGVKPEEIAAATRTLEEGLAALRQTAEILKAEGAKLAPPAVPQTKAPAGQPPPAGATRLAEAASEPYLRMLYEAAWCYRALAEGEIEVARQNLQRQGLAKVLQHMKAAAARPGQPPAPAAALNPPDVALSAIPVQASEKAALEQYTATMAAAGRSPLGLRVRLELAEMYAKRGQNDAALELLAGTLEDNPPPDLAERIHLRLAGCLLAKNNVQAALAQAKAVAKNATSSLAGEAWCLLAEGYIQNKDWPNAITQLLPFRDKDPWRSLPGLTDRALLRLGFALAQAQKWEESRQAQEALVQRFNQSPWVHEARFGMGLALQNLNQLDNACNVYGEVIRGTAAEVAARAQLQIGLCRLAQKRFPEAAKELLVVPYTYDYPEISAAALCEAGQACFEQKQAAEAAKLWREVVQNYAASKWAEVAKQRLTTIK